MHKQNECNKTTMLKKQHLVISVLNVKTEN